MCPSYKQLASPEDQQHPPGLAQTTVREPLVYINSQNGRYWSKENPRALPEVPLNGVKIEAWCSVSA
jgi:hypothetical protein